MKKLTLRVCLILFVVIQYAQYLYGGEVTPLDYIKARESVLRELIYKKVKPNSSQEKKRDEELNKIVDELIDFREIAKRSLGSQWDKIDENKREEYVSVLHEVVRKNYLKRIRNIKKDYQIQYKGYKVEGEEATVVTIAKVKEENEWVEVEIVYHLRRDKEKWKIIDIETDGVSLIRNYKTQFLKIIKEKSFDELLNRLKNKLKEE